MNRRRKSPGSCVPLACVIAAALSIGCHEDSTASLKREAPKSQEAPGTDEGPEMEAWRKMCGLVEKNPDEAVEWMKTAPCGTDHVGRLLMAAFFDRLVLRDASTAPAMAERFHGSEWEEEAFISLYKGLARSPEQAWRQYTQDQRKVPRNAVRQVEAILIRHRPEGRGAAETWRVYQEASPSADRVLFCRCYPRKPFEDSDARAMLEEVVGSARDEKEFERCFDQVALFLGHGHRGVLRDFLTALPVQAKLDPGYEAMAWTGLWEDPKIALDWLEKIADPKRKALFRTWIAGFKMEE